MDYTVFQVSLRNCPKTILIKGKTLQKKPQQILESWLYKCVSHSKRTIEANQIFYNTSEASWWQCNVWDFTHKASTCFSLQDADRSGHILIVWKWKAMTFFCVSARFLTWKLWNPTGFQLANECVIPQSTTACKICLYNNTTIRLYRCPYHYIFSLP